MDVSISKSVGRAFEVMELFKETRKPATATDIRKQLNCPHSSIVAVLHNLADLGYLSYNSTSRVFFPTVRFATLANWVQPTLRGTGRLGELVKMIAMETGQTASISCRSSVFLNIVHVATGLDHSAVKFGPGIGFVLFRSIPGLAVLSQLSDDEIDQIMQQTTRWSARAMMGEQVELDRVTQIIAKIRTDGHLISSKSSIKNIGVVVYPLRSPFDDSPLALSVSGRTQKIEADGKTIGQIMRHYLSLHDRRGSDPWPRFARYSSGQTGQTGRPVGATFTVPGVETAPPHRALSPRGASPA